MLHFFFFNEVQEPLLTSTYSVLTGVSKPELSGIHYQGD